MGAFDPKIEGRSNSPNLGERTYQVYAAMILAGIIYCTVVHRNIGEILALPATREAWLLFVMLVGLSSGILVASAKICLICSSSYRSHKVQIKRLVGSLGVWQIFLLGGVAACGEELVFRGVLQPYLGVWLLSCIIGLLHISPTKGLTVFTLMSAATNLLLGILADHTHSVIPGMVVHFIVNVSFLWEFLSPNLRSSSN